MIFGNPAFLLVSSVTRTLTIDDNTKPLARVGRKAHRVSLRQPGCRNIRIFGNPAFSCPDMKTAGEEIKEVILTRILQNLDAGSG
jgi:hypothetical protein